MKNRTETAVIGVWRAKGYKECLSVVNGLKNAAEAAKWDSERRLTTEALKCHA